MSRSITAARLCIVGGALLCLGAVLPWAEVATPTGTDRLWGPATGWPALGCVAFGLALATLGWRHRGDWGRRARLVGRYVGCLTPIWLIACVSAASQFEGGGAPPQRTFSFGFGLLVAGAGCLVQLGAGALLTTVARPGPKPFSADGWEPPAPLPPGPAPEDDPSIPWPTSLPGYPEAPGAAFGPPPGPPRAPRTFPPLRDPL